MITEFSTIIGDYTFQFAVGDCFSLMKKGFEQEIRVGLTPHRVDEPILGKAINDL